MDDLSGDEPISLEGKVDYIVHAVAVTTSKVMVSDPVGTIDVALKGTKNILNLAVEKETKGVVYISSMEIYGQSADLKIQRKMIWVMLIWLLSGAAI